MQMLFHFEQGFKLMTEFIIFFIIKALHLYTHTHSHCIFFIPKHRHVPNMDGHGHPPLKLIKNTYNYVNLIYSNTCSNASINFHGLALLPFHSFHFMSASLYALRLWSGRKARAPWQPTFEKPPFAARHCSEHFPRIAFTNPYYYIPSRYTLCHLCYCMCKLRHRALNFLEVMQQVIWQSWDSYPHHLAPEPISWLVFSTMSQSRNRYHQWKNGR